MQELKFEIVHLEVTVSSLVKARQFYVDTLGLEVLEENPAIPLLALRAGHVRISIFQRPGTSASGAHQPVHFVLKTDDIEKSYKLLTQRGVVFTSGITEAPGFIRFITTHDPDGNLIEIGQYLRDPLAPKP